MPREIHPLQLGDLDDLSRFLTTGFHTPPDADFALPDVLRWKFLEPYGENDLAPRSYLAHDESGKIVGHVGICRTYFEGAHLVAGRVATLHMIDWLGSPQQRSVGASLMRLAHAQALTQFGMGGSEAGRTMIRRGGYEPREPIPVYQRILRPSRLLSGPGVGLGARALRLVRDLVQSSLRQPGRSCHFIELVTSFDQAIEPIIEDAKRHVIVTSRTPARLNHYLQFPRQAMSGWLIFLSHDQLCGFALLNLTTKLDGRLRLGKIVDCLLKGTDVDQWSSAVWCLTQELKRQGADIVQAFAGPPWVAEALRQAGFVSRFSMEFNLRDRQRLIPWGIPFHLMPLEADYAYT